MVVFCFAKLLVVNLTDPQHYAAGMYPHKQTYAVLQHNLYNVDSSVNSFKIVRMHWECVLVESFVIL